MMLLHNARLIDPASGHDGPGDVRIRDGLIIEIADGYLENGTVHWHDEVEPVMMSARTPVARAFRAAIRAEGGGAEFRVTLPPADAATEAPDVR